MKFRQLKADEIDCRIQSISDKKNATILLYKDARCDMNILDETVGSLNWERSHEVVNGNLFCKVGIYDDIKNVWVTKQDVGTESMTEKEKGQASDSFKRACFNWGIGRELYTAPRIFIALNEGEYFESKDRKIRSYARFTVKSIGYTENKIASLVIVDEKGKERYTLKETVKSTSSKEDKSSMEAWKNLIECAKEKGITGREVFAKAQERYKVAGFGSITAQQMRWLHEWVGGL